MQLVTYVLNLERHPDRLAPLSQALDRQNIEWQRFSGLDGAKMPADQLDRLVAPNGPIPRMTIGARACTASHVQILKTFLETCATHALILEDDAQISDSLGKDLPQILEANPTGVLNINRFPPSRGTKKIVVKSKDVSVIDGYAIHGLSGIHYGTAGYVVDRSAAETVLQTYPLPNLPIDHMLFNPNISRLFRKIPIRQLFPSLVRPGDNLVSTIQAAKVDGADSILNKLRRVPTEVSIAPRLLLGALVGYYQVKTLEFNT